MVKAIIFDCFGVIYPDTLSLVERPYLKANDKRIQEIRKLRQKTDLGQQGRDEFWNEAAQILGISRQQLDQELEKVQNADWELLAYVKTLKNSGYKTAMLSNVGRGFLERIFNKKHPQEDYFDEVIASAEIGVMKPDARSFQITADRLGVEVSDCVFIDDREQHVLGARTVGMKAIVYQDFSQMKADLEPLLSKR